MKKNIGGKKGRNNNRCESWKTVNNIRSHFENSTVDQLKPHFREIFKFEDGKLFRKCREYQETVKIKGAESLSEEEIKELLHNCNDCWNEEKMEKVKIINEHWYWVPTEEEFLNIVKNIHLDGHHGLGEKAVRSKLKELKITCPTNQKLISKCLKECVHCQMRKSKRGHCTVIPYRIVLSSYPLQHLYIDLSFLPKKGRFIGFILLIDHFTKKIWGKPIPSKHASHVVSMLEETFCGIGLIPGNDSINFTCYLHSDNGGEFVAKEVKEICKK